MDSSCSLVEDDLEDKNFVVVSIDKGSNDKHQGAEKEVHDQTNNDSNKISARRSQNVNSSVVESLMPDNFSPNSNKSAELFAQFAADMDEKSNNNIPPKIAFGLSFRQNSSAFLGLGENYTSVKSVLPLSLLNKKTVTPISSPSNNATTAAMRSPVKKLMKQFFPESPLARTEMSIPELKATEASAGTAAAATAEDELIMERPFATSWFTSVIVPLASNIFLTLELPLSDIPENEQINRSIEMFQIFSFTYHSIVIGLALVVYMVSDLFAVQSLAVRRAYVNVSLFFEFWGKKQSSFHVASVLGEVFVLVAISALFLHLSSIATTEVLVNEFVGLMPMLLNSFVANVAALLVFLNVSTVLREGYRSSDFPYLEPNKESICRTRILLVLHFLAFFLSASNGITIIYDFSNIESTSKAFKQKYFGITVYGIVLILSITIVIISLIRKYQVIYGKLHYDVLALNFQLYANKESILPQLLGILRSRGTKSFSQDQCTTLTILFAALLTKNRHKTLIQRRIVEILVDMEITTAPEELIREVLFMIDTGHSTTATKACILMSHIAKIKAKTITGAYFNNRIGCSSFPIVPQWYIAESDSNVKFEPIVYHRSNSHRLFNTIVKRLGRTQSNDKGFMLTNLLFLLSFSSRESHAALKFSKDGTHIEIIMKLAKIFSQDEDCFPVICALIAKWMVLSQERPLLPLAKRIIEVVCHSLYCNTSFADIDILSMICISELMFVCCALFPGIVVLKDSDIHLKIIECMQMNQKLDILIGTGSLALWAMCRESPGNVEALKTSDYFCEFLSEVFNGRIKQNSTRYFIGLLMKEVGMNLPPDSGMDLAYLEIQPSKLLLLQLDLSKHDLIAYLIVAQTKFYSNDALSLYFVLGFLKRCWTCFPTSDLANPIFEENIKERNLALLNVSFDELLQNYTNGFLSKTLIDWKFLGNIKIADDDDSLRIPVPSTVHLMTEAGFIM